MTLQQLKYVLTVAECGSISEAAKRLFVSQPGLSGAIRDLENELSCTIFLRTSRGIRLTPDGEEFMGYVRQVIQQTELLEEKYFSGEPAKQRFCISTQHYTFAVNAFVELVKEFGGQEYEFTLRETKTYEIIEDVKYFSSELGVIFLSHYNETVIRKLLQESSIEFTPLFTVDPHVFVSRGHPLAAREQIELRDLDPYPCLSIEQGQYNSFYFSEEILSTRTVKKSIRVTDRAALVNFLIDLDAYVIATGVAPRFLHENDIIAIPLVCDEEITVGIIKHRDRTLSRLGEIYWNALHRETAGVGKS